MSNCLYYVAISSSSNILTSILSGMGNDMQIPSRVLGVLCWVGVFCGVLMAKFKKGNGDKLKSMRCRQIFALNRFLRPPYLEDLSNALPPPTGSMTRPSNNTLLVLQDLFALYFSISHVPQEFPTGGG